MFYLNRNILVFVEFLLFKKSVIRKAVGLFRAFGKAILQFILFSAYLDVFNYFSMYSKALHTVRIVQLNL